MFNAWADPAKKNKWFAGGDASHTEMRAQRFNRGATDRGGIGRCAGSGAEAAEHRQLSLDVPLPRWCGGLVGAFAEQALDIAAAVAPVAPCVDAEGGQPAGIGPGPDGVGMDAEERSRLGDADQRPPIFPAVAS